MTTPRRPGAATTRFHCRRRAWPARGVGYTVVSGPPANGTPGMSVLVFDPATGHTLGSYPLPAATGYPVGVSVGKDRRVVAATSDGQVYGFAPA